MFDVTWDWRRSLFCLWGIVTLWAIGASGASLPPDPDNAALLYYQAFLRLPEPNEAEKELVHTGGMDQTLAYLHGAPAPFDPNVEPRLRELEAKLGSPPTSPSDTMDPRKKMEFLELYSLRWDHERQEKMRNVDPNRAIRDYIQRCGEAITLAQEASELPECDWGIQHSKGNASPLPLVEIRSLSFVLQTDALVSAADGDYRAAFERCLMMRRFAHQIGDDASMLYVMSVNVDGIALRRIEALLGHMEPDVDTLTWLKQQLAKDAVPSSRLDRSLRMDFQRVLQSLRNDKARLDAIREAMRWKDQIRVLLEQKYPQGLVSAETDPNGQPLTDEEREELEAIMASFKEQDANAEATPDINDLSDEELVALGAKPYAAFLEGALAIMEGTLSYEDKIAKLKQMEEDIRNEYGDNRPAYRRMFTAPERTLGLSIVMACRKEVGDAHELFVRHRAHVNAVTAAIEVYLVYAREGHLPETLPPGLPRDPFTGRDFAYERTADGFRLSRADAASAQDSRTTYDFKVR